jgi:hypothetical protein
MERVARGALAVVALALGIVMAGRAPGAWACSCVTATDAQHFERADVVFIGTVTAKDDPHADEEVVSTGRRVTWTFEVRSVQKGSADDPADVRSSADEASCGFEFRVGKRYQVYAGRAGGNLNTGLCAGTRALAGGTAFTPPLPTTGVDPLAGPGWITLLVGGLATGVLVARAITRRFQPGR